MQWDARDSLHCPIPFLSTWLLQPFYRKMSWCDGADEKMHMACHLMSSPVAVPVSSLLSTQFCRSLKTLHLDISVTF